MNSLRPMSSQVSDTCGKVTRPEPSVHSKVHRTRYALSMCPSTFNCVTPCELTENSQLLPIVQQWMPPQFAPSGESNTASTLRPLRVVTLVIRVFRGKLALSLAESRPAKLLFATLDWSKSSMTVFAVHCACAFLKKMLVEKSTMEACDGITLPNALPSLTTLSSSCHLASVQQPEGGRAN